MRWRRQGDTDVLELAVGLVQCIVYGLGDGKWLWRVQGATDFSGVADSPDDAKERSIARARSYLEQGLATIEMITGSDRNA